MITRKKEKKKEEYMHTEKEIRDHKAPKG